MYLVPTAAILSVRSTAIAPNVYVGWLLWFVCVCMCVCVCVCVCARAHSVIVVQYVLYAVQLLL